MIVACRVDLCSWISATAVESSGASLPDLMVAGWEVPLSIVGFIDFLGDMSYFGNEKVVVE